MAINVRLPSLRASILDNNCVPLTFGVSCGILSMRSVDWLRLGAGGQHPHTVLLPTEYVFRVSAWERWAAAPH